MPIINSWDSFLSFTSRIRNRAEVKDREYHATAWDLAASVGIDHNLCCVHNASIDDEMIGWCKDNPERLAIAKHCVTILNAWPYSSKADRIYRLAWNRFARKNGMCLMN